MPSASWAPNGHYWRTSYRPSGGGACPWDLRRFRNHILAVFVVLELAVLHLVVKAGIHARHAAVGRDLPSERPLHLSPSVGGIRVMVRADLGSPQGQRSQPRNEWSEQARGRDQVPLRMRGVR